MKTLRQLGPGARLFIAVAVASGAGAQDWPHPGGDVGGTKHSPVDQITRENVASLEVAWTFDTGDWSDASELPSRSAFEATPLVIDGVLYVPSPFSRLFALDCRTGERRWHYQTIHHDIWDYDLPAQPTLVTVQRDGREVPAVAQVTKMGFVFVFHRETGEPLFPIEERPVPRSLIEGEKTHPTQPFPVKPLPLSRFSMTADDLTDVTPESRAECQEMTEGANLDVTIYDPLVDTLQVMFPGRNGGSNYGGASFDPESGLLFVNTMDVGDLFQLSRRRSDATVPFALRGSKHEFFWDSNGYPCQKPPWGHLTAIDLNTGEFRWRATLGEFEELKKRGVPKTGTPNIGGSIVTAGGLVFIAATNDHRFRAFNSDTGEELWNTELPASGFATPTTYLGKTSGRQFVVIPAGGGNKYDKTFTGKIVAFALPDASEKK